MFHGTLSDRLETLVDELIEEEGVDSAALASILLAAQDSLNHGYCMELSRWVWLAAGKLRSHEHEPADAPLPSGQDFTPGTG